MDVSQNVFALKLFALRHVMTIIINLCLNVFIRASLPISVCYLSCVSNLGWLLIKNLTWDFCQTLSIDCLQKPIRDNPKIHVFTKSEKMCLKSEKNFQIVMFFGNHRWRVYQIWKTVPNYWIHKHYFANPKTSLQIQEFSLNPEIFCKSEKNFCHVLLAAAICYSSAVCHIQNGGVLCLVFNSCGSKVNPGDKFASNVFPKWQRVHIRVQE